MGIKLFTTGILFFCVLHVFGQSRGFSSARTMSDAAFNLEHYTRAVESRYGQKQSARLNELISKIKAEKKNILQVGTDIDDADFIASLDNDSQVLYYLVSEDIRTQRSKVRWPMSKKISG